MSLKGYWNDDGPKIVRKTQFEGSQLKSKPVPEPERETWRDHPDQEAVKRAATSLCTKESHRDS